MDIKRDNKGRYLKGFKLEKLSKICPTCNKKFISKNSNQIFCSRRCVDKGRKHREKRGTYNYCSICNKKFYTYPYRIGINKFCSRKCINIGRKPWNKGTKGICKPNKTSFKKGSSGFIGEHSFNTKRKISITKQGINLKDWKGFTSFEPYDIKFNDRFKDYIRNRDNKICMLCEISMEKLKEKLAIHHIDYNKKNTSKNNCISLCNSCHAKTIHNRKQWILFFQSLLSDKYGYKYEVTNLT